MSSHLIERKKLFTRNVNGSCLLVFLLVAMLLWTPLVCLVGDFNADMVNSDDGQDYFRSNSLQSKMIIRDESKSFSATTHDFREKPVIDLHSKTKRDTFFRINTLVSHPVISIVGDADFSSQASSEGWPGDGTASNPYIISGYNISGNTIATTVMINDTTVHFILENNELHNGTFGILLSNVTNGIILNNAVYGHNDHGIYLENASDTIVSSNFVHDNGKDGIQSKYGMGNTIFNNTIYSNTLSGIALLSGNNHVVSNNVAHDNGNNGIYADTTNDSMFSDNELYNNMQHGINLFTFNHRNTLRGNQIYGNNWNGVFIRFSNVTTIENNNITGNSFHGIDLDFSNVVIIRQNIIRLNGWSGIAPTDSHDEVLEGNIIVENVFYGLHAVRSMNLTITSNDVTRNGRYGILLIDLYDSSMVENDIHENGQIESAKGYGLYLSNVNDSVISSNVVFDNLNFGIYLLNSFYNHILENTIENNSVGLKSESSEFSSIYGNTITVNMYSGLLLDDKTRSSIVSWNNFLDNLHPNNYSQAVDDGISNKFFHNYWSDGVHIDPDTDGIADVPYFIDGSARSMDETPLVSPFTQLSMTIPKVLSPNGGETLNETIAISWTAVVHPLNRLITYDIYFSSDGGTTWVPLVSGITNTTTYLWDTRMVTNGTDYMIKLVAIEGVSGAVTIDTSDDTFTIANQDEVAASTTTVSPSTTMPPSTTSTLSSTTTGVSSDSSTSGSSQGGLDIPNLGIGVGFGFLIALLLILGLNRLRRRG